MLGEKDKFYFSIREAKKLNKKVLNILANVEPRSKWEMSTRS